VTTAFSNLAISLVSARPGRAQRVRGTPLPWWAYPGRPRRVIAGHRRLTTALLLAGAITMASTSRSTCCRARAGTAGGNRVLHVPGHRGGRFMPSADSAGPIWPSCPPVARVERLLPCDPQLDHRRRGRAAAQAAVRRPALGVLAGHGGAGYRVGRPARARHLAGCRECHDGAVPAVQARAE
jgi:hypothetical protein